MQGGNSYIYRLLLVLTAVVLAGGTVFYHIIEKWSWLDAYYFCVVTLSTIGYGDLTPHTDFGKLFTTFYILVGVGIITAFFSATIRRRGAIFRQKHESSSDKAVEK